MSFGSDCARASRDPRSFDRGTVPVTVSPGARSPAERGSVTATTPATTPAMRAAASSVRTGAVGPGSSARRANASRSSVARRREKESGGDRREGREPDQAAPRSDRRREQHPVAVGGAELGLNLGIRLTFADALGDEIAHLARRLGGGVLHRQPLADRASQLGGNTFDALIRGRLVRGRRKNGGPREREQRGGGDDPPLHRLAPRRRACIPGITLVSSMGPMCRPAMTPSGPMKKVSGGPKTP